MNSPKSGTRSEPPLVISSCTIRRFRYHPTNTEMKIPPMGMQNSHTIQSQKSKMERPKIDTSESNPKEREQSTPTTMHATVSTDAARARERLNSSFM